jgi:hypothetical protein
VRSFCSQWLLVRAAERSVVLHAHAQAWLLLRPTKSGVSAEFLLSMGQSPSSTPTTTWGAMKFLEEHGSQLC